MGGLGVPGQPAELHLVPVDVQGQEYLLRVEPRDPVVPARGSLLVNCSTDCPDPELITLETSLLKELVSSGLSWVAFQLSNVTGDSKVLCASFCNGSQMTSSSDITVYREWMCLEVGLVSSSGGGRWAMP